MGKEEILRKMLDAGFPVELSGGVMLLKPVEGQTDADVAAFHAALDGFGYGCSRGWYGGYDRVPLER